MTSSNGSHESNKTNDNVSHLSIKSELNNKVDYFPRGIDKVFRNLVAIEVADCGLKEINNLENFVKLKYLKLIKNDIKVIESETFRQNKNLEKIELTGNKIIHIDSSAFHSLKHLKILDLRGNICISKKGRHSGIKKFLKEVKEKCANGTELESYKIMENGSKSDAGMRNFNFGVLIFVVFLKIVKFFES